jgi:hypothetical protein
VEFTDLVDMGTVDNRDLPSTILHQSFCYAAGLAVNLLGLIDNSSHCHEILAGKVGTVDRRMHEMSKHLKRMGTEEEDKVCNHRSI